MAKLKTELNDARVVLFSGDDDFLRRRDLNRFLAPKLEQIDEFDREEFIGGAIIDWLASVSTVPFLSERRLVVVRNILRVEPNKEWAKLLSELPESSLLVLMTDDESGDDSRQQRFDRLRTNWEELVTAAKGAVLKSSVSPKEAKGYVRKEAEGMGLKLSDAACEQLLDRLGGHAGMAVSELEKLSLYIHPRVEISLADIETVVLAAREWNVFKLIESIVAGQIGSSLGQLRLIIGGPAAASDIAFKSLLPLLSRQFRLLWQARWCIDHRISLEDIPDSISERLPKKSSLADERSFRLPKLAGLARNCNNEQLGQCFRILSDTDARLKGVLPGDGSLEALEQMVLQLGGLFKSRQAVRY